MSRNKGGSYRSASSGRFVTTALGQRSSQTTVKHAQGGGGSAGGTYRSAISGRFVTTAHGRRSPDTTIKDN